MRLPLGVKKATIQIVRPPAVAAVAGVRAAHQTVKPKETEPNPRIDLAMNDLSPIVAQNRWDFRIQLLGTPPTLLMQLITE